MVRSRGCKEKSRFKIADWKLRETCSMPEKLIGCKKQKQRDRNELKVGSWFGKTTLKGFYFRGSNLGYLIALQSFVVPFHWISEQRLFLFNQFVPFFLWGNLDGNCCSTFAVSCVPVKVDFSTGHELHAGWLKIRSISWESS